MLFAYLDHIDDSRPTTSDKLRDAINAAIAPLGFKVRSMMDEHQVTGFITGVAEIIAQHGDHEEQ